MRQMGEKPIIAQDAAPPHALRPWLIYCERGTPSSKTLVSLLTLIYVAVVKNALISVAIVACLIVGYMFFVDRQERKTYQAYVALDGKGPFARTDSPSNGPNAVVLYRKGRNGVVCFDFFHSKELHDYLPPRNGLLVTVQYDTFSDFGKVRGYNVHSVDGMILANGYHVLREDFAVSSGMTSGSALNTKMFTLNSNDCW